MDKVEQEAYANLATLIRTSAWYVEVAKIG